MKLEKPTPLIVDSSQQDPSTKAPSFGLNSKGSFGTIPPSNMNDSTSLLHPSDNTKSNPALAKAIPAPKPGDAPLAPPKPQTAAINTPSGLANDDPCIGWDEIEVAPTLDHQAIVFPVDVLDPTTAIYVRDTAQANGVTIGTIALPFLTAAGAAIGNAVKGEGLPGWTQPPILNTLIVCDSSMNKSGAMNGGIAPFRAVEDLEQAQHAERYGPPETNKPKRISATLERLRRAAEEQGSNLDAIGLGIAGSVPPVPQMIFGRTSLPGFENIAKDNPKGQLIVLDEAAPFLNEKSEFRQATLTAYNAETHKRSTDTKNINIANMGFSFVGGIQPAMLRPLYSSLAADGLGGRLLSVMCGRTVIKRVFEPVDQAPVINILHTLRNIEFEQANNGVLRPRVVPFTQEAGDLIHERRVAAISQQDDEDGIIASFIGKSHGTVVRLALILAFLDAAAQNQPLPTEIGVGPVERAGFLFDTFLLPMAKAVFGPETAPPIMQDARELVRILRRLKQPYISQRDLLRAKGQKLRKLSELNPVVVYLIEEGILRHVMGTPTGGRPSDGFDVNPRLWS